MMYDGSGGWVWMTFIPILWLALIGLVVWAVVHFTQSHEGHVRQGRETPEEILDRCYASGEIDTQTYTEARQTLASHAGGRDEIPAPSPARRPMRGVRLVPARS